MSFPIKSKHLWHAENCSELGFLQHSYDWFVPLSMLYSEVLTFIYQVSTHVRHSSWKINYVFIQFNLAILILGKPQPNPISTFRRKDMEVYSIHYISAASQCSHSLEIQITVSHFLSVFVDILVTIGLCGAFSPGRSDFKRYGLG